MVRQINQICISILVFGLLCGCEAKPPPERVEVTPSEEVYIRGNLMFTAFHEAAHLLISELEIPVIGREEDAADNLATLLLIPDKPDPDAEALSVATATGLFDEADYNQSEPRAWWDAHGMNEQRAFQILCLLAGADKNRFGDLAKAKGMPDERIDECAFEYDQTSSSWDALLSSHMLNENEASATNIRIIYETSKTGTEAEEILKSSQILEGLRDELLSSFKLPHDLTLRGKSCEEDNAYWDPETREIIMCYELVDGLRERYKPSKP